MYNISFIFFLLFPLLAKSKNHKPESVFDWDLFTIKASCAFESALPEGEYDEEILGSCIECFEEIPTAPIWKRSELVVNCSSIHLPNIGKNCSTELEDNIVFQNFWASAEKCFYGFVKKSDLYEQIQADVKETMGEIHIDDELDLKDFLLVSSCALETLLPDGEYDDEAAKSCMTCFDQVKNGDGFAGVKQCTEEYFPRIGEQCSEQLKQGTEFNQFWENLLPCLEEFVETTDSDGHVRADVEQWLEEHKEEEEFDWSSFIIRTSCAIDGENAASCVECFDQVESIKDLRKCTRKYLPNINTECEEQIEKETGIRISNRVFT